MTTPFTGRATRVLGFDGPIFVGLAVAGVTSVGLCRDPDLEAERRLVAAEGFVRYR